MMLSPKNSRSPSDHPTAKSSCKSKIALPLPIDSISLFSEDRPSRNAVENGGRCDRYSADIAMQEEETEDDQEMSRLIGLPNDILIL